MAINKKGVFLTFISIAIIAAIILIFTPSNLSLERNTEAVETRIENVNNFVLDLENVYMEGTLRATSRKALIGLISYAGTNGFFTDSTEFEDAFSQTMLTGEYNTIPIDGMLDNTYNDWLEKIKTQAKNTFNVDITYIVNSVQIAQTQPWLVDVEADMTFTISSETASWDKNAIIKTAVSVEDLDDPYYLVTTGFSKKIKKTTTKSGEWTVETFKEFITRGEYTHFENDNAPRFMDRLTDNIVASSCCGIETVVNPNDLNPADRNKALSYIDHKFFPLWQAQPAIDCDDVNLHTETDIRSTFNDIKFQFIDLVRYEITEDPLANIQQVCP
jgi:hypothetical protein